MKRAARHSNASLLPLILLAAIFAASPATAFAQKTQEADRFAQRGAESLARKDWKGARDNYQKAVRADPRHVEGYYGLGIAFMNLKQPMDALGAFSKVVEFQPNARVKDALVYTGLVHFSLGHYKEASDAIGNASTMGEISTTGHYFLGKAYQQMGRDADALPHLQAAIPEQIYTEDASLSAGLILVKQGKGREAVSPLETAVRLNSRNAQAQMLLGLSYLSAERPEEALNALRTADSLAPNQLPTQLGLGFAHSALYHDEEAAAAFNAALRLQPQSPDAQAGLGGVYTRMGRYREAEDAFASALSARPDDVNVLLGQSYLYYSQGQYTRLLETAHQAVRVAPQNAGAQIMLAGALATTGDMEGGLRSAREAARLEPENYLSHYALGFIYVREDKAQEALAEARTAARIHPNYPDTQNLLAYILNQLGQHEEALQAAQLALQYKHESTDEGWAYYNIASAQEKLSRAEEARASFSASIRAFNQTGRTLDPDDLYLMGNAYLRLDQDPQAIKAFQQAIKVRPDFPQARYNLGLAYIAAGNKKGAQDEYNALRRIDPQRAAKLLALLKK